MSDKTRMILVGSGKGGCGKTVVSMALLDHLVSSNVPVQLVETDTSNPDVAKAYKATVDTELINLDVEDGWIVLLNLCERLSLLEKVPGRTIVVNTGSRNNDALNRFGHLLAASLEDLSIELVTVWVIDGNRDCLELLHEYLKLFPSTRVHVVRNAHCARTFELYDSGKTREVVEGRGGQSLTLPALAERVMQTINRARLTFAAAAASDELQFGHKQVLMKWRREVGPICAKVVS
jgi:hypothetical protein